jgi:predicted CXXCH cytochrome family protein
MHSSRVRTRFASKWWKIILAGSALAHLAAAQKLDPAGWGGDHAGQAVPEYVHGDECLFCHRNDIGSTWQKNAHGVTVRQREDAPELVKRINPPADVEYFLGSRQHVRLLKKSGYGKFALLSAQGKWETDKFAEWCAGCHSTAVDPKTRAFSSFGLDCYTCHGVVDLEHTADTAKMWLSKKRRDDSRAITSICAQCHLRGGKSRSTGLPYPNNFVAGDNLFRDYAVDFSKADDTTWNAGDRHVYHSVRDVVVNGSETTCISCHRVHANSSDRHRRVLTGPICLDCHNAEGPKKDVKRYTVQSALCEY